MVKKVQTINIKNMIEEVQTINVKKFGEDVACQCFSEKGENLSIDDIYKDITYALHDGIKADIAYFAFKYLDDNNIPYEE